jgi:hypothetical protein
MASKQEKAFCVLSFERNQSVITVQRKFRGKYHTNKAIEYLKVAQAVPGNRMPRQ